MILLSIFTAQQFNSVLAYLQKPSMILYVYVYLNDPKKHSHHVDIRNKNNNGKNCARTHLKTISTTQIWVARVVRQQYGPSALDRFSGGISRETIVGVRDAKCRQ